MLGIAAKINVSNHCTTEKKTKQKQYGQINQKPVNNVFDRNILIDRLSNVQQHDNNVIHLSQ